MIFHAENRVFPRFCVSEHSTVREYVNQCECVLGIGGLVGLMVSLIQTEFGAQIEIWPFR
jgi:hypothetical protein